VNSYSRDTLRAGHHQTANGPYGAPRGNPVMKAKRTTGQSAQGKLCAMHTRDVARERAMLAGMPGLGLVREDHPDAQWYEKPISYQTGYSVFGN
jgi:hypothetical protein